MKNLTIKDIIKVTNGELITGNEKHICKNYSRDSRQIKKGDCYIGIKGENFDGSKFWKEALDNGADCIIVQNINFSDDEINKYKYKNIIKVNNTLDALQKIAEYKRSLYNISVIGITGSVGKTSTKDIIANVVSQKYKTMKTKGNNNGQIGLPFTILSMQDEEIQMIGMNENEFTLLQQFIHTKRVNINRFSRSESMQDIIDYNKDN